VVRGAPVTARELAALAMLFALAFLAILLALLAPFLSILLH